MPLDEPWVIVVLTVVAVFAIRVLVIFILAGGDVNRIKQTIRASFRILRDAEFAAKVQALLKPPPPPITMARFCYGTWKPAPW